MRNLSFASGSIINRGYWNDVIHDRLYFGDGGGGASTINAGEYRIFINSVGQRTSNISTGATVTQTEAETSLEGTGGTIPNGEWFVINQIGINLELSNVQATTPFTNDAVTSVNVTPLYKVSPIPLIHTISQQCTFELYRNTNDLLEKGNITEYPCEFTSYGFAGGSGASVPALAGGAQNAYTVNPTVLMGASGMRFRELTVLQSLNQRDEFRGIFKVNRQIALASTLLCGQIDFYLVGRAMIDIEYAAFVAEMNNTGRVITGNK